LYACGTLSKALGGFGGIIPGTETFIQRVRSASHYFDGASAPASAVAGSSACALEMVRREPQLRQQLKSNAMWLREQLRQLGLHLPSGTTAHFGVSIGDAGNMVRIHGALRDKGIMLPYVGAYAGLPSEGVLRVAVFASHQQSHIDRLVSEIRSVL
jgi:7-keto-8-aminopelargonate synthetase-like enzyme